MFTGMRIYTSDKTWRQILSELNATVLDVPNSTDINFDELQIPHNVGLLELKSILLHASDDGDILCHIFGKNVSLPQLQSQIVVLLYKSGGMTTNQLKSALGYAPDVATHTVDMAIYQLRRTYGHEFIINTDGVYKIGKL